MDHARDALGALARVHGDAYYLVDPDRFRANLRGLIASLRNTYPRTRLGYSYKTNYLPLLCRIADAEGCYAEVVSGMEYDLAQRLGIPGERIIFNGPWKPVAELEKALLAGALVNVDSLAEVSSIEDIARRRPEAQLRVGLRCHASLTEGHVSRFGLEGEELAEAYERLARLPACRLEGLHLHSSAVRDAASFARRAEVLVATARALFGNATPAYLDIGGGLFGHLSPAMREQFDGSVPSWDDVAEAVGSVLARAYGSDSGPTLVLEPGAAVVADAVTFVCRVAAVKQIGPRTIAIVTGSIQNIKARPNRIRLPLEIVPDSDGSDRSPGPFDVMGYTCLEADILATGVHGDIGVGDYLVFGNAGAYTNVFKPQFIRPAPPMLVVEAGGHTGSVTRRPESLDDVLRTYVVAPASDEGAR